MSDRRVFLKYVIPAVLSFALSGVYSIVDGFFVGNSIGDMGLSAINVAYPIVAVIQAAGTGIGMGGAVYYSIYMAEKKEKRAREFSACALWMLILGSILLTALTFLLTTPLLRLLGAQGELLRLGEDYISVIALGAAFQVLGTGLVPFIRNHGGPFYAMISMVAGFGSNIVLDYLLVWVWNGGITGATLATVISQGVTMLIALIYLIRKKKLTVKISRSGAGSAAAAIVKIGIAPFGLSMTPNVSPIIINRFSIQYGGDEAVAVYACIAYIICIIYLILQGVGDGSQPLFSRYYGEGNREKMKKMRRYAYGFAMLLALAGCVVMFAVRGSEPGDCEDYAGLSCFGPVCGGQPDYHGLFLCNGKDGNVLCADVYGAGADACTDADSSAAAGRADHDLVEHSICKSAVRMSCAADEAA